MRFQDRVVIVTGGGAGIGRAIALAFAREGAHCVLASRRGNLLEATADELRALGTRPEVHELNVTHETAVATMVRETQRHYGRIDVLVNNAGIMGPTAPAHEVTAGEWRDTIAVNVTGAFLCAKYVSAAMIEQKRGAIVNISSIAGRIGYSLRVPYAASKWAMIGLSHSLAAELGPYGVRSNVVLPGPVEGERVQSVIALRAQAQGVPVEEAAKFFTANLPLGHMVTSDDVAEAVTFLASDAAKNITGQALNVDSGYRMQ